MKKLTEKEFADFAQILGGGLEHEYFVKLYFAMMVWTHQIRSPEGMEEPPQIRALRRFSDDALKGGCRFLEKKDWDFAKELNKILAWPKPKKEAENERL